MMGTWIKLALPAVSDPANLQSSHVHACGEGIVNCVDRELTDDQASAGEKCCCSRLRVVVSVKPLLHQIRWIPVGRQHRLDICL
jgi:hypothetical protein